MNDEHRTIDDLIALFGARSVHPVGLRVGGFHRLPEPAAVAALALAGTVRGWGFPERALAALVAADDTATAGAD